MEVKDAILNASPSIMKRATRRMLQILVDCSKFY